MTVEPETLPAAAIGACSHAVHFYDRDDDLADRVVRYLAEGLLAGEAAVIVASQAHRELFVAAPARDERRRRRGTRRRPPHDPGRGGDAGEADGGRRPEPRSVQAGGGQRHRRKRHAREPEGEGARLRRDGRHSLAAGKSRGGARAGRAVERSRRACSRSICCAPTRWRRSATRPAPAGCRGVCDTHTDVSITPVSADGAPRRRPALARQTRALAAEIAHRKQVEQTLRSSVRELRQAEARERERAERTDAARRRAARDRPHQRAVHGRAGARSARAAGAPS